MSDQNLDKYFLSAIVESSQESIVTVDFDMVITTWNKGAETLYGYPAAEVIGKPLTMFTLPEDLQMLSDSINEVKNSRRVKIFETYRRHEDGRLIPLEIYMSPVKDEQGKVIGVSTFARDLTERKAVEKALRDSERLQNVLTAQEDERARLSRDLHDDIGQQITALRFKLMGAEAKAIVPEVQVAIREMEQLVQEIDRSLDYISWNLRPAAFDMEPSLVAAINNFTTQWSRHSGIPVKIVPHLTAGEHSSPAVDTNLYRIMQEALNNVHKHADATEVEVTLTLRDDNLVLIIADDGKGFDPNVPREGRRSFGLVGMRERAALIGATFEIESTPGYGTTVFINVPVQPATAD